MSTDRPISLDKLDSLPAPERVSHLAALGREVLGQGQGCLGSDASRVVATMVDMVQRGEGSPHDRMTIGAALGLLGDPRLRLPDDEAYWATVTGPEGSFGLGRFMVTNHEFRRFVDAGGYDTPELWDEAGLAWLAETSRTWARLAEGDDARPFIVPNQPVVGVTWFEASAYANWVGARLPLFEERLQAVRGDEKRPYPWGSPFGEGNANTSEEVLNQPCAVGLYVRDRSPEGIYDLAGNVAEWCGDGVSDQRWVHPGAWDQPSMAAWAKARVLEAPNERSTALGFRLGRDA